MVTLCKSWRFPCA